MKLVARNALLAASDQIHRLQPDIERNVRAFKDSANPNGEGLAALVALVQPLAGGLAAHKANALHATAMRAGRAIRPNARFDIIKGGLLVVKVAGRKCGNHDKLLMDSHYVLSLGMSSIITPCLAPYVIERGARSGRRLRDHRLVQDWIFGIARTGVARHDLHEHFGK